MAGHPGGELRGERREARHRAHEDLQRRDESRVVELDEQRLVEALAADHPAEAEHAHVIIAGVDVVADVGDDGLDVLQQDAQLVAPREDEAVGDRGAQDDAGRQAGDHSVDVAGLGGDAVGGQWGVEIEHRLRRYARATPPTMAIEREPDLLIHHDVLSALAARLRADLPALAAETEGLLHREMPELVRRVDPPLLRDGIADTHERFVARLEGAPEDEPHHIAFAAAMAAAGVPVELLLAGYRVGAQVCWRHVAAHLAALDAPAEAVIALATASMAYTDDLAANSLEGFAREAAALGGARARERQALLDALVAGRLDDARAAAAPAGWPLPDRLHVAVLLGPAAGLDERALLLGHADGTALAVARAADADALVGAGVPLALGPAVPPEQAPLSLVRARRVAALARAGVLPQDAALRWDDHLAELVVHADPAAADALAARRLAPLDGLPPARAALLRETLAAWLDHPGRPREIARALHLHHQTVRYRLARLRERFGDALDDPQARFELALALRTSDERPPVAQVRGAQMSMSGH